MCGRYVTLRQLEHERVFAVIRPLWQVTASWNVAPTRQVPVVRLGRDGVREGVTMRWGLVPFFAHGVPPKYSTTNARVETLESAASYRGPWKRSQRCLLPAAGFYEWQVGDDGRKQAWYIHLVDQEAFGFAGLWDRSEAADGTVTESCTIITLPANDLMAQVHNTRARMPAILAREDHDAWLGGPPAAARAALQPYPDGMMVAYRVGARVNSPRNDDPSLIEPLAGATAQAAR
ncbi:MAG: SOS response-associated peptidase [Gammaproteobacteria bacterium]|nr:SOS response-associated peptidase [Gammaproteobacteria bacterium]